MVELSLNITRNVDAKGRKWGEKYVENDVTTSQLRQIYGDIKRAETEFRVEDDIDKAKQTLVLLKPHLAYAASRHDEMEIVKEDFFEYIDKAVNGNAKNIEAFFQLMEATMAYHSYFGEKGGSS